MSPIPITMIGIAGGHWFHGAESTATSMIGMIALGGIIVRQSILIVEFVKIGVEKGMPVREAAVSGAEIRMRPILITSLTLMAGAFAILTDPIFNGMAISLLWGAAVGTVGAVLIIPLGCISCAENFYYETNESCERIISDKYEEIEGKKAPEAEVEEYKTPLWMRLYGLIIGIFTWIAVIVPMVINIIKMIFGMIMSKFSSDDDDYTPPPPRSTPPATPPSTPPPAAKKAPVKKKAEPNKAEVKKAETKKTEVKKVEPKKVETKKVEPVAVEPEEKAVKEETTAKKTTVTKKTTVKKKVVAKKVAKKKAVKIAAVKKAAPVKKAPSKKSPPGGRRGIRLKDD